MLKNQMLIACVLGATLAGHSQAPPTAAPAGPSPSPALPAPVTFHSDLLNLSFNYPASLVVQPLPSLKEQHDALVAREPADEKPEDRKTDQCSDKALVAVRKDDPDKLHATVTIHGDNRGTVLNTPAHAVTAKIVISRIGVDCMPAAYQQQLDNMAAAMSAALAQDRDLRPIDQPIWYEVDKARVHFAAGESVPNQNGTNSVKKTESRWVGSAAFVWTGNLISIVIESNDLTLFNEMLHGKVALGKETAAPLFPAEIGQGKQIKPKGDAPTDEP